ncbi:hypothetical protein SUGI_0337300 [Cryptomeria japonica]|nr:hypothetical protein SUGI_0337300 [Cryptomeria japonica]
MDSFIRGYKIPSPKKYGVFLSFRGIDVRKTFGDHLYQCLSDAGINVYMDERSMDKGESIDDALKQAIEDSAISIPIFSTNYASSPHCLQELTHMCKSKALIKPLFYNVQPYQVRYADCQPRPAGEPSASGQARTECESVEKVEGEKEARAEGGNEIRRVEESEARAEGKCGAIAEDQRNGRTEEESEAKAEWGSGGEKEARAKDQRDARAEGGSEMRIEGERGARAEVKCEAIAEDQRDGRAEEESDARVEGESGGKIEGRKEARAESGSEIKIEGESEARAEDKCEGIAEDQRDGRAEDKSEARTERESGGKIEGEKKVAECQRDRSTEDKSEARPERESGGKIEDEKKARSEDQRDARTEGRSEIRTEAKSDERAEDKCEAIKEDRRDGRAEEESEVTAKDQRDGRGKGKSEAREEGESGTNPYGEALKEHRRKGRYPLWMIDEWRQSLKEVSNINGWTPENTNGYEGRLVKQVVYDVIKELDKFPYQNLPKHPVQLDKKIEEVIHMLNIDNKEAVLKIGIWGLDGIGKTTVAKAVFNGILQNFDAYCFLSDLSAKCQHKEELKDLQEQKMKYWRFNAPDEGRSVVAQISALKRILIVLDDVVDWEQLEILIGENWAGPGSRIIVTTPDKHVLNMAQINTIYKMEGLEYDGALRLFSWHAFLGPEPEAKYAQQCKRIVEACGGLPLALKVVGDNLRDKTDDLECWNEAMSTPQSICHQKIYSVLRPSYEKLTCQEKRIFLHIACSCIGKETEHGIRHWKKCNWNAHTTIKNLEHKSLISRGDDDTFMMHKLLRDMGEAISKAEGIKNCRIHIFPSISNLQIFTSFANFHIKSPPFKRSEKKCSRILSENRQSFSPGAISDLTFIEGAEKFELQDFRGASPVPLGSSASVFGSTYKVPLNENRIVVVKELTVDVSSKGDFEKVMELSAKLKHRNVAGIEAFYHSPELKFVVQRYFPNRSLHHLLHGNNGESSASWESYRNIALGVVKGLCFIHDDGHYAHGNLKSSNILLDDKKEAFISDLIPSILSIPNSTSWKTRGYNSLEYAKDGKMTKESDVFAYGVLLLEILTRQEPPQSQSIDNVSSLSQWIIVFQNLHNNDQL